MSNFRLPIPGRARRDERDRTPLAQGRRHGPASMSRDARAANRAEPSSRPSWRPSSRASSQAMRPFMRSRRAAFSTIVLTDHTLSTHSRSSLARPTAASILRESDPRALPSGHILTDRADRRPARPPMPGRSARASARHPRAAIRGPRRIGARGGRRAGRTEGILAAQEDDEALGQPVVVVPSGKLPHTQDSLVVPEALPGRAKPQK